MPRRKEIVAYVEAFHQEVTGSSFLVTVKLPDGTIRHIMIDCGLYQEPNYARYNYNLEVNIDKIDAILITHNHMDHVGGVPKLVHKGYNNPIYTTIYTMELMSSFLSDSANHQLSNILEMKKLYPNEKFSLPYSVKDVEQTMNLVKGIEFYKTFKITDEIKVTFFPNGHLIGAGIILIQISYYGVKDVNLLFTGDYKNNNLFFEVPELPDWVKELPITVVTESTYGHIEKSTRIPVFNKNIKEAIEADQDILVGVFAQGRMQELLYQIKYLQEIGTIPDYYQICVDGPLGIETSFVYRRLITSSYNYYGSIFDCDISFFPKNLRLINKTERENIFADKKQKIVITTSGMLSHGPAQIYVPLFLQRDAMIHLTGYASEGTLARTLIDSYENRINKIEINGSIYPTNATVKWTNEFSSHATASELIDFLKQFSNLKLVVINHGEDYIKECFKEKVKNTITCKNTEIIDRSKILVIGTYGLIKSMPSKKEVIPIEPIRKDKQKNQHCPNRHTTIIGSRK